MPKGNRPSSRSISGKVYQTDNSREFHNFNWGSDETNLTDSNLTPPSKSKSKKSGKTRNLSPNSVVDIGTIAFPIEPSFPVVEETDDNASTAGLLWKNSDHVYSDSPSAMRKSFKEDTHLKKINYQHLGNCFPKLKSKRNSVKELTKKSATDSPDVILPLEESLSLIFASFWNRADLFNDVLGIDDSIIDPSLKQLQSACLRQGCAVLTSAIEDEDDNSVGSTGPAPQNGISDNSLLGPMSIQSGVQLKKKAKLKLHAINLAFEVLKDNKKRKIYEAWRTMNPRIPQTIINKKDELKNLNVPNQGTSNHYPKRVVKYEQDNNDEDQPLIPPRKSMLQENDDIDTLMLPISSRSQYHPRSMLRNKSNEIDNNFEDQFFISPSKNISKENDTYDDLMGVTNESNEIKTDVEDQPPILSSKGEKESESNERKELDNNIVDEPSKIIPRGLRESRYNERIEQNNYEEDEPPKILSRALKESDKTFMSILRAPSRNGNKKLEKNNLSITWNEEVEEIVIYAGEDKHKKGGKNNSSIRWNEEVEEILIYDSDDKQKSSKTKPNTANESNIRDKQQVHQIEEEQVLAVRTKPSLGHKGKIQDKQQIISENTEQTKKLASFLDDESLDESLNKALQVGVSSAKPEKKYAVGLIQKSKPFESDDKSINSLVSEGSDDSSSVISENSNNQFDHYEDSDKYGDGCIAGDCLGISSYFTSAVSVVKEKWDEELESFYKPPGSDRSY